MSRTERRRSGNPNGRSAVSAEANARHIARAEPTGAGSGIAYDSGSEARPGARAPYTRPALEPLGSWRALTLQQSVPIFP